MYRLRRHRQVPGNKKKPVATIVPTWTTFLSSSSYLVPITRAAIMSRERVDLAFDRDPSFGQQRVNTASLRASLGLN